MSRRTWLSFRVVLLDFLWEKSRSSCHFMPFHANLLKRFCEKSPKTTWWHRRNLSQSLQFWNPERWRVPAATVLGIILLYTSQSQHCGRSVPVGALPFGYALSIVIKKLGQHWQSRAQKGSTGSFVYCVVYFACFTWSTFRVIALKITEDQWISSLNIIAESHHWIPSLNLIFGFHRWIPSLNFIIDHYWIPVVPHEAVAEVPKIWTIQDGWNVLMSRCEGYQLSETRCLVSWSTWCNWSFWRAWLIYLSIYLICLTCLVYLNCRGIRGYLSDRSTIFLSTCLIYLNYLSIDLILIYPFDLSIWLFYRIGRFIYKTT